MTGRIDTIKKRVVYENDFVVIHDDDVRFPSGTVGDIIIRNGNLRMASPF